MRALILIAGMVGVVGAAAAGDPALRESDAVSGQLVYQLRFGGERDAPAQQSFQLQVANDWQRQAGFAPMRAEYRMDTQQFLVNGVDFGQMLIARQAEEGGLASLSGWIPLLVVLSAASFILIDGQELGDEVVDDGTGVF
jgi:hypothetical protein